MGKPILILVSMIVVLTFGTAWGSQPGQPLVWEDWIPALPGLGAEPFATREDPECTGNNDPGKKCTWLDQRVGADGSFYWLEVMRGIVPCAPFQASCSRWEIWRTTTNAATERVAYIEERGVDHDRRDGLEVNAIGVDPTNGYLYIKMHALSVNFDPSLPLYDSRVEILRFRGLTTLFEILQTYTPTANAIQFRVPSMPDGFRSPDHFYTYWGHVSDLPDFGRAKPVQCAYPKTPATAGDYLTVPDTSPLPSPGEANYSVTAVTYGTDRRYGRKRIGGVMSGRDPALLPACPTTVAARLPSRSESGTPDVVP